MDYAYLVPLVALIALLFVLLFAQFGPRTRERGDDEESASRHRDSHVDHDTNGYIDGHRDIDSNRDRHANGDTDGNDDR